MRIDLSSYEDDWYDEDNDPIFQKMGSKVNIMRDERNATYKQKRKKNAERRKQKQFKEKQQQHYEVRSSEEE